MRWGCNYSTSGWHSWVTKRDHYEFPTLEPWAMYFSGPRFFLPSLLFGYFWQDPPLYVRSHTLLVLPSRSRARPRRLNGRENGLRRGHLKATGNMRPLQSLNCCGLGPIRELGVSVFKWLALRNIPHSLILHIIIAVNMRSFIVRGYRLLSTLWMIALSRWYIDISVICYSTLIGRVIFRMFCDYLVSLRFCVVYISQASLKPMSSIPTQSFLLFVDSRQHIIP